MSYEPTQDAIDAAMIYLMASHKRVATEVTEKIISLLAGNNLLLKKARNFQCEVFSKENPIDTFELLRIIQAAIAIDKEAIAKDRIEGQIIDCSGFEDENFYRLKPPFANGDYYLIFIKGDKLPDIGFVSEYDGDYCMCRHNGKNKVTIDRFHYAIPVRALPLSALGV